MHVTLPFKDGEVGKWRSEANAAMTRRIEEGEEERQRE